MKNKARVEAKLIISTCSKHAADRQLRLVYCALCMNDRRGAWSMQDAAKKLKVSRSIFGVVCVSASASAWHRIRAFSMCRLFMYMHTIPVLRVKKNVVSGPFHALGLVA